MLGAAVAQAAEPETTITANPGALSNDPTADFEFESNVPMATFECRLDGAPFGACASPHSTASLSDGAHDFEVRAVDGVETDSSPASHTFTVDTEAPGTTISTDPGALTTDPTADFEFSASEPGSSSECRVNGGIWQACSSPHATAALADGNHSFQVRATDPAGNVGLAATHGFQLDSTPPQTTIASKPAQFTNQTTSTFTFTGSDPAPSSGLAGFECSLDGAAWAACTTGDSYATPEGDHDFRVRGLDTAGNIDPSPASWAWMVDTTDPVITINVPQVKQHFLLHQGSDDYSCDDPLSGGPPPVASGIASCTDNGFKNDIPLGPKLFTVEARDRAGNEASETRAYVIDPRRYGDFVNSQDPIAFFRMNEELGSSEMLDRSGNGHDGTYQGDIALGRGPAIACERRPHPPRACELDEDPQDYAAHFPARDGHGYANGIPAPSDGYTMEAWVKPADSEDMMVIGHGGGGQLFISDGRLAFRQVQDTILGGGPTLTPGEWWHVAATWNGSSSKLYVNGTEVGSSGSANAQPTGTATLYVGYGEMAPWFRGEIDEAAYYDRALNKHAFQDRYAIATAIDHPSLGPGDLNTAGPNVEINQPDNGGLYLPTKVPVSEFGCTDPDGPADISSCTATVDGAAIASGGSLPDSNGEHELTVNAEDQHGNSYSHTHTYRVLGYADAVNADEPVAYYRLGDLSAEPMADASGNGNDGVYKNDQDSGPVGVSGDGDHARAFFGAGGYGYVNGIAAPAYQMTLEAWIYPEDDRDQSIAGHGDAAELFIKSGELRFRHMDVTVGASVESAIGAWQHVAGVWDGVTIRIFVNGVEVGSAEATKRPSSASTFYVGFGELAPWFTGAIDEVAYYDRALEPERIYQHWLTDAPPEVLDPIGGGGGGGGSGAGGGGSGGGSSGGGGSGDDGDDDGEDPVAMAVEVVGKPKLSHHALKVKLACVSDVDCEGTASARLKVGGKRYALGSKSFEMRSGKTRRVRFGIGRDLRRKMSRARVSATVTIESPSGRVLARARAH